MLGVGEDIALQVSKVASISLMIQKKCLIRDEAHTWLSIYLILYNKKQPVMGLFLFSKKPCILKL